MRLALVPSFPSNDSEETTGVFAKPALPASVETAEASETARPAQRRLFLVASSGRRPSTPPPSVPPPSIPPNRPLRRAA